MSAARAIRRFLAAAALLAALPVAGAHAVPPVSLGVKLHLGASAAAPENYQFTSGNQIFAEVTGYSGASYRLTAIEPNGTTTHTVTACTDAASSPSGSYTVGAADPVSGTSGWVMRLEQFSGAGCSGVATAPVNQPFDVATASTFDSSTLTTPKTLFARSGSAFVAVTGIAHGTSDWTVKWTYGAGDTLACANLSGIKVGNQTGTDLPDSSAASVLPGAAPAYLQYPPSGTLWNASASYDAFGVGGVCPFFLGGNDGQWFLTLSRDATHFVRLPVFNVDATAPAVSVTAPADGSFRSPGAATVSGAAGTAAGDASNVTVTLRDAITDAVVDGPNSVSGATGSWSIGTPSLGNGQYRVDVAQVDAAGNTGTASSTFTVDGAAPHPAITVPSSGAVLNSALPTFQGTAGTTAGASPDSQQMTLNIYKGGTLYDSHVFNRSGGGWQTTPTTSLTDGSYTAEVVQSDAASNTGTSPQIPFSVDTVAPVVSLGQPADGALTDDNTPSFSGGAGNLSGDGSVRLKIWNGTDTTVSPARSYSFAPGSSSWAFTVPDPDALADGDYTARAEQTDTGTNTGFSDYHHFTVDATGPSSNVTAAPAYSNGDAFTMTYAAADSGPAGLQRVELWVRTPASGTTFVKTGQDVGGAIDHSFSFTPSAGEGTYYFYTVAVDNVGHVESPPSGSSGDALTELDSSTPGSQATSLAAFTGSSTVNLGYTAADNAGGVGLDHVELWVKRGTGAYALAQTDFSPASPTFAYSAPADDTYCFYTVAVDKAANAEAAPAAASGDTCTSVDTAKPSSSADALAANSATRSLSVGWNAADNGGGTGLDRVDLYAKQGAGAFAKVATNSSPGATGSFAFAAPDDDTYCFYTVAVDKAANAELAPAAATGDTCTTVDTAAPAPTATVPNDPGNDARPALAGTAGVQSADSTHSADTGAVTVRLWTGSSAGTIGSADRVFTGIDASSGLWQLQTSDYVSGLTAALGDGVWTARVYQSDGAGNTGNSSSLTFTVDTAAPSSSADALPDSTGSTSLSVGYHAADTGGGAGLDHVDLYVKQGAGAFTKTATDSAPGATGSFPLSSLTDSSYCFYTVAVDKAGNAEPAPGAASGDACTQVDTVKPSSAADAQPANSGTQSLSVGYQAADDAGGVGLARVELWVKRGAGAYAKQATDLSPGATGTLSYSAPADDTYCFYTLAVDRAGNIENAPVSTSGDTCTNVDTGAPTSQAAALAANSGTRSLTIAYAASDNAGGLGLDHVDLYVRQDAGAFSKQDTDDTPDATQSFSYDAPADGSFCFYTVAVDKAGNADATPGTPDTCTLVDSVEPSSSADTLAADSDSRSLHVAYHAADNTGGGGLARVELWVKRGTGPYAKDGTDAAPGATGTIDYTAPADDAYCFYTVAVDQAGNREDAPAGNDTCTTVDVVEPAPTMVAQPTPTSDGTPPLHGTAGQQPGDAGTVTVSLWKGPITGTPDRVLTATVATGAWALQDSSYTSGPAAPLDDGDWTATVSQDDSAGNTGTSSPAVSFVVDRTSPVVALATTPAAADGTNDFYTHVSVRLTVSDVDIDPGTIGCTVDGGAATLTPVTGGFDVPVSGDATHDVSCSASDHSGNSGSDDISFKLDGTAPAVTLAQPSDGAATRDVTPSLSGVAGSQPGDGTPVTVKIYSGGTATGTPVQTLTPSRTGSSWSADSPALGDGAYTAVAEQSDQAGNVGRSAPHGFKVDTHAPSIASGNDGQAYPQGSNATATYSCTDESGGSGVAACGGDVASGAALDTSTAGPHTYHVTARDAAGNELGATVSYTVSARQVEGGQPDTQAPDLSAAGTRRSQGLKGGALNLDFACSEACTVSAGGTLSLPGGARVYRLKAVSRKGSAGAHVKIKLKLDKATLKAVRKMLAKHKRVTAKVKVTATDASGNRRSLSLSVRITKA